MSPMATGVWISFCISKDGLRLFGVASPEMPFLIGLHPGFAADRGTEDRCQKHAPTPQPRDEWISLCDGNQYSSTQHDRCSLKPVAPNKRQQGRRHPARTVAARPPVCHANQANQVNPRPASHPVFCRRHGLPAAAATPTSRL